MSKAACELCKKQPATVHYTEIADSEITKLHLCEACARGKGLLDEGGDFGNVEALMSTISRSAGADEADLRCPECELTWREFEKRGKLGCGACYGIFGERLAPLLRQIHAHDRHAGKTRGGAADATPAAAKQLAELRAELEQAVRDEDYERAARLRDEIRALESALEGEGGPSKESAG